MRGKSAVDEINELVESRDISVLVIGLRKRTAVGKLLLGSVAQELLMTVSCPVLCVKGVAAAGWLFFFSLSFRAIAGE